MMIEGVRFDPSVRLGDILTLIGFLGVGITAFVNIKATLKLFGFRLDIVDASIEDLKRDYGNGKVQDAEIARLKEDGVMMRREIFELQRDRGYIGPEIDGEYMRAGKVK